MSLKKHFSVKTRLFDLGHFASMKSLWNTVQILLHTFLTCRTTNSRWAQEIKKFHLWVRIWNHGFFSLKGENKFKSSFLGILEILTNILLVSWYMSKCLLSCSAVSSSITSIRKLRVGQLHDFWKAYSLFVARVFFFLSFTKILKTSKIHGEELIN